MTITAIKQVLQIQPELELAVLVGRQADGRAHAGSDRDIAIQWN
ncbi:MAG: nucleotidyltransferase domain-containing protein [Robiginitomaculum sp.]|nr:nucleotidyltransferase domain-containing protein [Robiginitomaculum sp.]